VFTAGKRPPNGAADARQTLDCVSASDARLRVEAPAIVPQRLEGATRLLWVLANFRPLAWGSLKRPYSITVAIAFTVMSP
jgi:hypothetical protein